MPRMSFIKKLSGDQRGGTAIEYGLIVALIVIAMIAALSGLGSQNAGGWGSFSNKANEALSKSN